MITDYIFFENDDSGFHRWCEAHPDGFVLNIRAKLDKYMLIHKASCRSLKGGPRENENPHTGHKYRKVCSLKPETLDDFTREQHQKSNMKIDLAGGCKVCNPELP